MLEVLAAVKRVSGRDFLVEATGRRAGDPAALVADVGRIHHTLDWQPQFDDLDTIVSHALAWERRLMSRAAAAPAERLKPFWRGGFSAPFQLEKSPRYGQGCANRPICGGTRPNIGA